MFEGTAQKTAGKNNKKIIKIQRKIKMCIFFDKKALRTNYNKWR